MNYFLVECSFFLLFPCVTCVCLVCWMDLPLFYIRFSSYFPIDFVRLSNRCPRIVLSIFIPSCGGLCKAAGYACRDQ